MASREDLRSRVLVLAPIGRDAHAASRLLANSHMYAVICKDVTDLCAKIDEGAAAALITEEAFLRDPIHPLKTWVERQPPWSDFPFVILTSRATSAAAHGHRARLLEKLGNVSLLERPFDGVTLTSAVRAALRARKHQYQVQDHLTDRETWAAQLEDLVRERTRQLEDTNHHLRREISERKQAEAALQQAQKMEIIGQMTGGVAHDFNNLLTAVLGNLELATRGTKDDSIRRYLDGATQAAQRGAKLTSQLLAFSPTQRLQPEPIDLNTIVTKMGDLLFQTIGGTVRIETILQKDLWHATADPAQIESVILNLALNARDAMPNGGRVTISTANIPHGDPNAPAELAAGDYVAISVTDIGSGMTDDVLTKAFEPFFTTKPVGRGTGLGLSQVYGIVKQTGGTVCIRTKLGQGTTVIVFLPRTTGQAFRHPAEQTNDESAPKCDATVLVVDDDRDVRELAVSFLESLGYRVLSADGGAAGIEMIEGGAAVDLILVDVAMPEINGVDAVKGILKRRPGLPFLYMTGYPGPTKLEVSEHRVLKKPFTIAELGSRVAEALAGVRPGVSPGRRRPPRRRD
jgi:signal transduction histidine kinase/CheY-like chemotaxis protein